MSIRLDLYASETGELLASAPVAQGAMVNRERRLVGGLAVPWNIAGQPSTGRTIFRPNSITAPLTASWVKLLVEHDTNRSVGTLAEYRETPAGLLAALRVADGPAGDAALDGIENGTRDALSVRVEVDDWRVLDGNTLEVRASRLREISLVSVPAYVSARASVLAALPTNERSHVMTELDSMLDLSASAGGPAQQQQSGQAAEGQQQTAPPAPPAGGQAGPADLSALVAALNAAQQQQTAPPAPPAGGQDVSALVAALNAAGYGAPSAPPATPERPAPPANGPARQHRAPMTVEAAASMVAQWSADGNGNPAELVAALNDVVPSDDAGGSTGVSGDNGTGQWLGKLWEARRTDRPYVSALGTPRKLTSLKAYGWRWTTRPAVGDYDGDKTAIPSNDVTTEPASADAYRVAGGWDVDRAFYDLGDQGLITAMFEAATEDYAVKSNTKLGAALLAGAGGAVDGADLVTILVNMGAAAATIGARVSFLALAPDLFGGMANLTRNEVPWWMGSGDGMNLSDSTGNVGGFRFWSDPSLTAGTFVGGDARAATFYEQGSTPIRAQALNIPNGGIDLGVFGYNAVIVNDDRAIFKSSGV